MARDDERHRVVSQGRPDGTNRLRPADLGGDPAIRPDLAARDLEGLAQTSRSKSVRPRRSRSMRTRRSPPSRRSMAERRLAGRLARIRPPPGPGRVLGFERGVLTGGLHGRDAEPVPGHDSSPIGESIRANRSARPTSTRTPGARRVGGGGHQAGQSDAPGFESSTVMRSSPRDAGAAPIRRPRATGPGPGGPGP